MNSVIIDNYIVSKFMENGVNIQHIRLELKLNPNFDLNLLQKITYGNRTQGYQLIQQLSDGILKFHDLNNLMI